MPANSAPESTPPAAMACRVLLVGLESRAAGDVIDGWQMPGVPIEAIAELAGAGPSRAPAVICFGSGVSPATAAAAIEQHVATTPAPERCYLILAAGQDIERFEPLVERDLVFYLAASPPAKGAILALLSAAIEHLVARPGFHHAEPTSPYPAQIDEIEKGRDPEDTLGRLEKAARELTGSRHAVCRWLDAETQTLWRPGDGDRRDSVVSGLVGFVARTGAGIRIERLGEDPRYDAEADNGRRSSRERFAAVALPAGPGARHPAAVEAVLSVSRGARQAPFTAADVRRLQHLADEAGPILRRRRLALEQTQARSETEIFRAEALAHRERGLTTRSEPLRITPPWLGRAYRAVLVACFAGLLALPFAGSSEYAVGPAVVRFEQRTEVRARAAGVLERLNVSSGDRVRQGQEVGRLESSEETAQLEQLRQELELRLVERLRHPDQTAATGAFVALRERQRVASARLERRRLRAPRDGLIGDLMVRPGRPLVAGQPVASVVVTAEAQNPWIDVLLPGSYRPMLEPGMEIRFKIDGYPDVEQQLTASAISQRVISSRLASQIVEPTAGDAVGGGQVIVRAELPAADFDSQNRRYPYFDGMTGTAELQVRKRRFVIDWLRRLV